ncbi:MAG: 5-methylthioadenosine/S-adenosylhomocysteine deaminase [Lentisphaerae bacterium ADurb.Bin082]|nr:MAG: 5-methylthioadenosine/S-adenosylhomocysteine deaminase [Lentisphaerae bacterium ADurb.Bin082]
MKPAAAGRERKRMNQLLIKNTHVNGALIDVLIQGNRFAALGADLAAPAGAETLDAAGMAMIPAFYNAHTHAAMSLFRGFADDLDLFVWLNEYIWPAEAKLTPEDIYDGSRLAILEMIKTGTVFFNDMYWSQAETIRAAEEMGVRAAIGLLYIESSPGVVLERNARDNAAIIAARSSYSDRIMIIPAPHAIYTVSGLGLKRAREEAQDFDGYLHIHAAETQREVDDCQQAHQATPIAYLDRLGVLGPRTILAHCCHLTDDDIAIIRERDCVIVHNPCSNLKLVSGRFRFQAVAKAGIRIALGTDGCSSNNNLSMLEEMKFAALAAKDEAGDPTAGKAEDVFAAATAVSARAFGLDAGEIAPGQLADCLLLDSDHSLLVADHHLLANVVYSADSSCIDTVICNGRVLMRHRVVPGEEDIIARGKAAARRVREYTGR